MTLHVAKTYHELMTEAKEAEEKKELEQAAKLYERAIRLERHEDRAYDRLMIVYRRLTWYEEELKLIKKAISTFEEFYQKKSERIIGKNKTAERLSNALAKSLGQRGKKTEDLFFPEPIPKWIRRQKVVEKKLGLD